MVDQTSEKIQKEEIPEKEQIAKYFEGKNEESLEEFLHPIKNVKGIYAGEFEINFRKQAIIELKVQNKEIEQKKIDTLQSNLKEIRGNFISGKVGTNLYEDQLKIYLQN